MTNGVETESERKRRILFGWAFTIFTFAWWIGSVGSVTWVVATVK